MNRSDAVDASAVPLEPSPLSADAVRAAVGRILASPDFSVSDRDKRFLSYVVDEVIAGRADRIKAYSIATAVFGRNASFDAQTDPVVRIEAGRVRRALEHYFLTSGQNDEIVTTIPKGGYVPVFSRRPSVAAAPAIAHQSAHPVEPVRPAEEPPEVTTEAGPKSLPRWAFFAVAGGLGLGALLVLALLLLSFAILNVGSL